MKAFKEKHNLPYTLLSDTDATIASVFGIKPGTRQTVVIGKDGKLEKIYPKAVPKEHPAEVLKDLGAKK
jgi:thioredoxin-dependent peroxiredoxin